MNQKDKMLRAVLNAPELQKAYDYDVEDYECLSDALSSSNAVVSAVAKIIKELNGSNDTSEQARVYKTIFTHLNNRLI